MNESKNAQDQAKEQGQEARKSGANSSTRKVRGDGSATLGRLNERRSRQQASLVKLEAAIQKQAARVLERAEKAASRASGPAKAINTANAQ